MLMVAELLLCCSHANTQKTPTTRLWRVRCTLKATYLRLQARRCRAIAKLSLTYPMAQCKATGRCRAASRPAFKHRRQRSVRKLNGMQRSRRQHTFCDIVNGGSAGLEGYANVLALELQSRSMKQDCRNRSKHLAFSRSCRTSSSRQSARQRPNVIPTPYTLDKHLATKLSGIINIQGSLVCLHMRALANAENISCGSWADASYDE